MSDPSVLAKARDEACVVQIRTRFSDATFACFPIEVGEDLILVLMLDDGFHMDGMRVMRPGDIAECICPHPHESFLEEVLRLRGEDEIELPALSIECMAALLETALVHLPLFTFHREEIELDKPIHGRVLEVDEEIVQLLELDEDARWAGEPTPLRLSDLTRVDLGGARLEAFYLVAGEPD